MRHIIFDSAEDCKVAILLKESSFNNKDIQTSYVTPLNVAGVTNQDIIAFSLEYNDVNKVPAAFMKSYLDRLLPILVETGVTHLYVADSSYFKALTKQTKADVHLGYVLPCKVAGYAHLNVVLGYSYQMLFYNPEIQTKIDRSLVTLVSSLKGSHVAPGHGIIHSAKYPKTLEAIAAALEELHQYESLTCDIEAFSLRFNEAGVGTISFAWDEHNGIAFPCDYWAEYLEDGYQVSEGVYKPYHAVRALIKQFFEKYKGELTFHNATYDVKVMIYTLWMQHGLDTEGLLQGLKVMTARLEDTKIIAYLATNSTAGNELGLKVLAHSFAGNWAKDDIEDIRKIKLDDLLEYNLVDALSTFHVKNKYTPIMVADNQEDIYRNVMLPSITTIIQMELTGMPMGKAKIQEVKAKLMGMQEEYMTFIMNSGLIKAMNLLVQTKAMTTANAKLKTKQHAIEKFKDEVFNPNSGPQLQRLLYELMGLPVIDYTDTKMPATGAETIEKLIHHTQNPSYVSLLEALIGNGKVTKILSTFIPAFEGAIEKSSDGIVWLHGSFNLGGTVSGRLSSSEPNLQNIPANSLFGKLIKELFLGPMGWLMCGADFNSLEDMISALTTKDPNKLAVYEKGFCGHSLRAAYYFKEELEKEGIFIDTSVPASVNQLKKTDHWTRQESKAPTFLLTYGGTHHGMMNNLGWSKEKSKRIEDNYHELYKASDAYIQSRIKEASKVGYTDVAFGLRVRAPLLKQVIYGAAKMPYEAAAEGRTAGNAMGQSYGLLNNRAANEFMSKVRASKYRLDIKIIALIHDAIYLLIKDDVEVMEWANRELILSMQWQDLPEIQHPTVKLGAALDIFWPNWANPITLPNGASQDTIKELCNKAKEKH